MPASAFAGANARLVRPGADRTATDPPADSGDDPHPALFRSFRLNLRIRQLDCYDYATVANPPVLHRKDTFLRPDDERHAKFAT
jgi:hypothetical protein